MDKNKEIGNCRFCNAKMTIYQQTCPNCQAKKEDCFLSNFLQKEGIKAMRAQIIENIKTSFKERRW